MVGNNLGHQLRHFVRSVKFTCFFTSVGCKIADEVFINKAEDIIVLFAICRNILNQLDEITNSFCLVVCVITKFAQTGFQSIEDLAKHLFLCVADQTIKCRKSGSNIVDSKTISLGEPC